MAAGTSTITATFDGVSGGQVLTVNAAGGRICRRGVLQGRMADRAQLAAAAVSGAAVLSGNTSGDIFDRKNGVQGSGTTDSSAGATAFNYSLAGIPVGTYPVHASFAGDLGDAPAGIDFTPECSCPRR